MHTFFNENRQTLIWASSRSYNEQILKKIKFHLNLFCSFRVIICEEKKTLKFHSHVEIWIISRGLQKYNLNLSHSPHPEDRGCMVLWNNGNLMQVLKLSQQRWLKSRSSWLWCHVVSWQDTSVSEVHAASIFRVKWRWR